MTINELLKIDYRDLNENAIYYFNISDQGGLYSHFGNCKNIQEINETANELYNQKQIENLIQSIEILGKNPDLLENFKSYLERHYTTWCKKYASTPDGFISELKHFSDMEV